MSSRIDSTLNCGRMDGGGWDIVWYGTNAFPLFYLVTWLSNFVRFKHVCKRML